MSASDIDLCKLNITELQILKTRIDSILNDDTHKITKSVTDLIPNIFKPFLIDSESKKGGINCNESFDIIVAKFKSIIHNDVEFKIKCDVNSLFYEHGGIGSERVITLLTLTEINVKTGEKKTTELFKFEKEWSKDYFNESTFLKAFKINKSVLGLLKHFNMPENKMNKKLLFLLLFSFVFECYHESRLEDFEFSLDYHNNNIKNSKIYLIENKGYDDENFYEYFKITINFVDTD